MNNWFKRQFSNPIVNHFGRNKEQKHFSKPPIFIGGCARSGTSLLLSILSAHPHIHCLAKETDAFTEWEAGKPVRIDRMYRELLRDQVDRSAYRWCEKRPYNVRYISEILDYFPEARFLHIVRDPRAVCTSVHPKRPDEFWVSPERYIHEVKSGIEFRDHPQVLMVKYEELIINFDSTITQVCDFLNEPLAPEIQSWFDHATVRSNRAWFGKLEKLKTSSLERWKLAKYKNRIKEILENKEMKLLMDELRYS